MMRQVSAILLFLWFSANLVSQNPHGAALKTDCAACHSPAGWEISPEHWKGIELEKPLISKTTGLPFPVDTTQFHHNKTTFPLQGRHTMVDCRDCHETLVFEQANSDCISCHTDIHQMTVGNDCARCHNSNHWLVDNITELHQENGFPLTGVHTALNCNDCHTSETELRFDRIGNDCVSCHLDEFSATTNPNHKEAGFSTDCLECHDPFTADWNTDKVDHSFFPLTKGHEITACAACHIGGDFANTPNNCFACHQPDFENTLNPNHVSANFTNDCAQCHTTDPDWAPAQFLAHDGQYFPIYSGKHNGVWNQCSECHTDPNNYATNSCIICHLNPETDDGHTGVAGYVYENSACLACHPTGDTDGSFDHNAGNFPLTGAHITTDCIECHANGYAGTPTECAACHTQDFNETTNPNHGNLGLSNDCASCHTTDPGWSPATFDVHNDFYVLNGAHAMIANDCATCHNGNYNNTPNTCIGCHTTDFNAAADPNHVANQFPNDCTTCHSETSWVPSTFDHASVYPFTGAHIPVANECTLCHVGGNYSTTPNECAGCHTPDFNQSQNPNHVALNLPMDCASCHTTDPGWEPATFAIHDDFYLLNGAHAMIANDCATCHNGNYNNTPNTCMGCHTTDFNAAADPNHVTNQFPNDCTTCHSETSWVPSTFDHASVYPFTGAHIPVANECTLCHVGGNYSTTPNECAGCHTPDFNQSQNPNHVALNLPNDCAMCHTTTPDWEPAQFPIHDDFYVLNGAHAVIANDCAACHNGDYNNTPNTCFGCHSADYNATANPNHVALNFSQDCTGCHSETTWSPATFDHDGQYFPIYSGAHNGEWSECIECHTNPANYTEFTCTTCHANPQTNDEHAGIGGYIYESNACLACHPMGDATNIFDHNTTAFPLTGAHLGAVCLDCHASGFQNTPTDCTACHTTDFNQTQNPNHVALNLPMDCASCHTTDPGWEPATFAIHDDYYVLNGAHAMIANDCATCHNGNYNNTPNTCIGCHTADFNAAADPNHVTNQFPNDCTTCHTETSWVPSTFDHASVYPFTGAHIPVANDCALCHVGGNYSTTPNECAGCHTPDFNQSQNPNHVALNLPNDCAMCHTTTPDWEPAQFPIHDDFYVLNGAHAAIANDCATCHNGDYNNTPNTCFGCHASDYNNTTNPNHAAAQFSTDCTTCHSETAWVPSTFDHDGQYFPIYSGTHNGEWSECTECHTNPNNFAEYSCTVCHVNPETNNLHAGVGGYVYESSACLGCHPTGEGTGFDHNNTAFPLTGAHLNVDCIDCHSAGYQGTPTNCDACHLTDFNQSQNPNHVALGIPMDCASCHTTDPGWAPASFPIHDDYWALTGAHIPVANDCATCHNGNYNNTPNTCAGCHTPDYNASTNPNHVALGIPMDCEMCHTTEPDWEPATFPIHNNYYQLNGAHAAISNDCATCHNGNYNNTPNTCAGCHIDDYNGTTNPNHAAVQFPTTCNDCHTETAWVPANFDHNAFYPLIGAHAAIANDCAACHIGGNYTNTPNTCNGCHNDDYAATTNPNHAAAQFPTTCEECHTETSWVPSTFSHSFYPFTGAHIPIANDCALCHIGGNYNNTPNTCAGCHTPDYNASINPNHVALGIPNDCEMCHTTAPDWEPATFPIHNNYYPLNGAHATIANDCAVCHNGNYNNTPNTCAGCHIDDYNGTTNPNHSAAQLPTTCEDCHTETAWVPSTFDHSAFYPFTGAHIPISNDCALCHAGGNYNNTPNTCEGCHLPDYNASTNPNHIALAIPTDCAMCHTTDPDWDPATFPIHNQYYQLNGAHAAIANDCAVCHNGDYNNTPNTCYGCHQPEYNSANNPNHVSAGFPTDCTFCHTETAWVPSTFDHDGMYFPIYSGKHKDEWNQCIECHTVPNNFTLYSCIDCHEHDDPADMADKHQGVSGYQYVSTACYACHPDGSD